MPSAISQSSLKLRQLSKLTKFSLLSLIILSFSMMIVYFDNSHEEDILAKHHHVMTAYLYTLKKEKIADIVTSFVLTIDTINAQTIRALNVKLQTKLNQAAVHLNQADHSTFCPFIKALSASNKNIHIRLSSQNKIKCESALSANNKLSLDIRENLTATTRLNNDMVLSLTYPKSFIKETVKPIVVNLVKETAFQNPDIYLWINEVHNFSGGDNYATRIAHGNLTSTVGQLLSTNTQDIQGNSPYLEELEGIKEKGHAFLQYSFKKKTSQAIKNKLSYAQLYQPYNWVIATGVYIDDIEVSVNNAIDSMLEDFSQHNITLLMTTIFLSLVLIYLLYSLERKSQIFREHQINLQFKNQEVKNYRQVLNSILDLVEQRDSYTAGHTKRVAKYSSLIAKAMNIPKKDIKLLYEAAMMHDIGKTATPDSILLKPGKLTQSEYKIIQHHLDSGYAILSSIKAFKKHADIMRDHHEYYNGKGYPRGRKGDEISILSHILILADAFDAMTSKRIYRESKSLEKTLAEIDKLKGIQFCPQVVEAALPVLEKMDLTEARHDYLSNEFEQARLAYHYKDPLTELYNYKYLTHVLSLNEKLLHRKFCCGYYLSISNFGLYNQKYGWLAGDKKLVDIAETLIKFMPNATSFRVLGDDFLVLSVEDITIDDNDLIASLLLEEGLLTAKLQRFGIDNKTDNTSENLAVKINTIIGI